MAETIVINVVIPPATPVVANFAVTPVTVVVEQVIAKGDLGDTGATGAQGDPGANAVAVILTLAEYLALPLETQTDGRWYIIPKTI